MATALPDEFLSQPVLTPPPWTLPQGVEARRAILAGQSILVIYDSAALAAGTQRGWIGIAEATFDPANLKSILPRLYDQLT